MTSPRLWQTEFRTRRVPAIVAAFAMLVLAACSAEPSRVELPAKPTVATQAVLSEPAHLTPRQQVLAALTGYTGALSRAEQSRSVAMARRLLRPYLAASRIGGLLAAVSAIWARGERFYGEDVLHILGVRIDGNRAFVHDCDNTSRMGLENAATGQAIAGSAGVGHANLVTRLDQVAGRWMVESQLPEDEPCAP